MTILPAIGFAIYKPTGPETKDKRPERSVKAESFDGLR